MADLKVYNDGLSNITKQLKELNDQANRDASVKGDDARFGQVLSQIQTMRAADGVDEATKAKLDQLNIDVSNLQGLAGSPDQRTKTTNSSWQVWTNDINELIKTMPFNGAGDPLGITGISEQAKKLDGVNSGNGLNGPAYKYLNDEEAAAAGLKGEVADVQKHQEVKQIKDAKPPVYISSSNTSPITYDVFNADGAKINKDPIPENSAIGLNDGKTWLKFNAGGIGHAVPVQTERLKDLPSNTHLYDLASLSDSNKQLVERGLNDGGTAPTQKPDDKKTADEGIKPFDLKDETQAKQLIDRMGTSSNKSDFTKFLENIDGKMGWVARKPDSTEIDQKGTVERLEKRGFQVYTNADTGSMIVYDPQSKVGGIFDGNGMSLPCPIEFWSPYKFSDDSFEVSAPGMKAIVRSDGIEVVKNS